MATDPARRDFKKALEAHVENRPDRDRLVQLNIIQSSNADPKLQGVMRRLAKAKREDELAAQLKRRSKVESLLERGILLAPPGEAWDVSDTKAQKKKVDKNKLSQFIAARPTLKDIMKGKQGSLFKDTMMWTRQVTQGAALPVPRNCHTMVCICDKGGVDKLYLLGGFGTGAQSSELLVYDSTTCKWSKPLVGGVVPTERYSHTCSGVGSQLVLFGGFSVQSKWLNDLHFLDTDFVQPFNSKLSKAKKSTQTMMMWYEVEAKGTPPCPRAAHTATVVDKQVIIFAGNDGKHLFNDLFILDTETMTWNQPTMSGPIPSPRAGHTANVIQGGKKLVIFGGGSQNGPINDLHILDLATMEWSRPKQYGTSPSPRAGHTATTIFPDGSQILVFGGGYLDKAFNDLHIYDAETSRWSRPTDTGTVPIPRAGHTMTVVGDRLFIFGGGDSDNVFNDMNVLDTGFFQRRTYSESRRDEQSSSFSASASSPSSSSNSPSSSTTSFQPTPPPLLPSPSLGASNHGHNSSSSPSSSSLIISDSSNSTVRSGTPRGRESKLEMPKKGNSNLEMPKKGNSNLQSRSASSPRLPQPNPNPPPQLASASIEGTVKLAPLHTDSEQPVQKDVAVELSRKEADLLYHKIAVTSTCLSRLLESTRKRILEEKQEEDQIIAYLYGLERARKVHFEALIAELFSIQQVVINELQELKTYFGPTGTMDPVSSPYLPVPVAPLSYPHPSQISSFHIQPPSSMYNS